MKRVLALLAAAAMVAGAFAVRGGLDGGGGLPIAGGGDADVLRLHCATELAPACRSLAAADDRIEVREERPGRTADALLAGTELSTDVWLAPRPWVELVRQLERTAPLGDQTDVLARSPLVVAAFDAAATGCVGEPLSWRCIGGAAPGLRPGVPHLDTTAGLFTLAQAGSAYFDTEAYATNDFEAEPEAGGAPFVDWAAALLRAVPRGTFTTPLDTMLLTDTATFDFAASIEAVAATAISGTRQEGSLRLIYPLPMASVDVVAVANTDGDDAAADELLALLRGDRGQEALAGAGWRVGGRPLPPGADPAVELRPDDGLPEPGVLAALRSLFA